MVTLPNNGDVKLTKEYDNLRNQLVEAALFSFLGLHSIFRYRKIDFTRVSSYIPTIREKQTCSVANILDQEALRNKFNYSFDLPENPSPHIMDQNYTTKNIHNGELVEVCSSGSVSG